MNAWLPQASYPCGNFSDTSSFKFKMCRPSQTPHQTMSSTGSTTKRVLGLKEGVVTPPPIHGVIGLESSSTGSSFPADSAKPVPLAVVSLDSRQGHRIPLSVPVLSWLLDARESSRKSCSQSVPRPTRGGPLSHVSSSSSPPTVDGGCSPWRPDAVMRPLRMHRHHATCGALPAAGPYLR
ncbi:unnamed protein product [Brassica napus]|uniref:(rape) hypothetical protein n=1 Tax=Brassica napus TaxID=3708 RepID=A0A816SME4_BRANA|nr:unnamed protein product [Brassica napus]